MARFSKSRTEFGYRSEEKRNRLIARQSKTAQLQDRKMQIDIENTNRKSMSRLTNVELDLGYE